MSSRFGGYFDLASSWLEHLSYTNIQRIQSRQEATGATALAGILVGKVVSGASQGETEEPGHQDQGASIGFSSAMAILHIGKKDDSNLCMDGKLKAAKEIRINTTCIKLVRTTVKVEALKYIPFLNEHSRLHGFIAKLLLDSENP